MSEMNPQTIFEMIGYVASVLIAISLMMKSLIRLRLLNGLGALIFVIYGLLIKSYPVTILNGLIVIIDLFYLFQMNHRSDYFTLMEISPESTYLEVFLRLQKPDIAKFFPNFDYHPMPEDRLYFVLRNTVPAGIVIIRKETQIGHILLDYALPDFRDFKIGAFVFKDHADTLLKEGIEMLVAKGKVATHKQYLTQMGFRQIEGDLYRLELEPHIIHEGRL